MTTGLAAPPLRFGDPGYDEGRAAWNPAARQTPAVVVMAESAQDGQAPCGSREQSAGGSVCSRRGTAPVHAPCPSAPAAPVRGNGRRSHYFRAQPPSMRPTMRST